VSHKRAAAILGAALWFSSTAIGSPGQELALSDKKTSEKELERRWKKALDENPLPITAVELEYLYSIPNENTLKAGEFLFWKPKAMARNKHGDIFVMDQKWRHIFQMSEDGRYLRTIGRAGQGPGEFRNPWGICADETRLMVIDNSNLSLQFFDFNGNFIKSRKVFKAYLDMATDSAGHICAAPLSFQEDALLVDIFDREGEYLNSIAKPVVDIAWNRVAAFQVSLDMTQAGDVIIAYSNLPFVCRYSIDGKLKAQWDIEQPVMKDKVKFNMERFSGKRREPEYKPITVAVQASAAGGFYVLHDYPRTDILKFDDRGRLLADYWFALSHDYDPTDFRFVEETNEIYVLQRTPEARIDVFRPRVDKRIAK